MKTLITVVRPKTNAPTVTPAALRTLVTPLDVAVSRARHRKKSTSSAIYGDESSRSLEESMADPAETSLSSAIERLPDAPILSPSVDITSPMNSSLETATAKSGDEPAPTPRAAQESSVNSSTSLSSSDSCDDHFTENSSRLFPPLPPFRSRPQTQSLFATTQHSFSDRAAASDGTFDDSDDSSYISDEDGDLKGAISSVGDVTGETEAPKSPNEGAIVRSLWRLLQDQRSKLRELRANLSNKRTNLQDLRKRKDVADNSFMALLRAQFAGGQPILIPGDLIMRRFDEMQDIRNIYHVEEAEVEQLELDIDREESSREVLEMRFFSGFLQPDKSNESQNSSPSRSEDGNYAPPSKASLMGIPVDRPTDVHPLYKRLLGAVGDRELAREHQAELVMHRDAILYDLNLSLMRQRFRHAELNIHQDITPADDENIDVAQVLVDHPERLAELRDRYSLAFRDDDYEFLSDFIKEEAAARERFAEAKVEVERLRALCTEKGVMRKNPPYHEEYTIFSDLGAPFADEHMSINHVPLSAPDDGLVSERFPILLSNPRHLLDPKPLTAKGALREATRLARDNPSRAQLVADAMKEYGISTLVSESEAENKSDFINRWLLQRLRTSSLEVELLYTIFSDALKVRNKRRWQEDVLYYWSRDGANKAKDVFEGSITSRDALVIDEDNDRTDSRRTTSAVASSARLSTSLANMSLEQSSGDKSAPQIGSQSSAAGPPLVEAHVASDEQPLV